MKKLIYIFAIIAIGLYSCTDKNDISNSLAKQPDVNTITDNANGQRRPVILGKKLNNPYSVKNMQDALDTIKNHSAQQNNSMKAPGTTVEDINVEPTDLYVRFLPADRAQFVKLMTDTTLIIFDYPLDYEKTQTGDYYKDPTVTGEYTWLYAVVPTGYQPHNGIQYEVIEELFIPEHSTYYNQQESSSTIKGVQHIKSNVVSNANYTDVLKNLEVTSFILTGNGNQLNKPTTQNAPAGMQKSATITKKWGLFGAYYVTTYNPEGYVTVATPYGYKPIPGIRIRVARYFTAYETRTDANGRFYFNNQFGQDAIFPNIEYFVYFDGINGSNFWRLCDYVTTGIPLWTTGISVGVQNPNRYDITFTSSNYFWGESVQHTAINNYMDNARNDGISLPASSLNIISYNNSDYTTRDNFFTDNIAGGGNPDMVLRYQNTYTDYCKIIVNTWHKFTNASQINKMISVLGSYSTSSYWNAIQNQLRTDDSHGLYDCFGVTHKLIPEGDWSQFISLTEGWANYRLGELYNRSFGILGYTETNSQYLKQYVKIFSDLHAIGCSYQNVERALCNYTIAGFRNNLIYYYPSLSQQINSIVTDPDLKIPGNITFMTYNLKRDDYVSGGYDLQNTRIYNLSRIIANTNPDVVAFQEIEDTRHLNFDILKRETGLNGDTCLTESFHILPSTNVTTYGIGILWKPSLGTPKITKTLLDTEPEKSPILIAEFSDFYFISTHYHAEFNKISDAIITFAKSVDKPVYIGGDFNMNLNAVPKKDDALQKYLDNGFVILNKPGDITTYDDKWLKDLLIGYKKNTTEHNVILTGIPVFPDPNWYINKKTSDHLPYFVTVKL